MVMQRWIGHVGPCIRINDDDDDDEGGGGGELDETRAREQSPQAIFLLHIVCSNARVKMGDNNMLCIGPRFVVVVRRRRRRKKRKKKESRSGWLPDRDLPVLM
jgi:hypothetical protein